jgi:hypothetical protein
MPQGYPPRRGEAAAAGGEGHDGARWSQLVLLGGLESLEGLGARLGGCAGEGGGLGIRESIFKISHTKSRKKIQNLDLGSDRARGPLHLARRVYEGEESREGRQAGRQAVCGGEVWRLLREMPSPSRRPGAASGTPPPTPPHGPERRTCRAHEARGTCTERLGALACPWARPGRWCDRVGRGF